MKTILLQEPNPVGLLSEVAQVGIAFTLLVAIVLVLAWLVRKLYNESKEKSKAHGDAMALKDAKIEELSELRRQDSIDSINFVRDLQDDLKKLSETIKELIQNVYGNK